VILYEILPVYFKTHVFLYAHNPAYLIWPNTFSCLLSAVWSSEQQEMHDAVNFQKTVILRT